MGGGRRRWEEEEDKLSSRIVSKHRAIASVD
jgi:hypothetical protein